VWLPSRTADGSRIASLQPRHWHDGEQVRSAL